MPLTHGVAIGDITSNSALVWFRTAGPALAWVDWKAEQADGRDRSGRSAVVHTDAEHDYTATLSLKGLTPATRYRYRIHAAPWGDGELPPETAPEVATGRIATAAAAESAEPLTFVWSGDLGGQHRCRNAQTGYAIFDRIRQMQPAFAIMLGDLIYGDDRCPSPPNAPGSDFVATNLDGYRAKHRYQREDQALQRFLEAVPVYAIWDDHEVKNNFSGPTEPLMPVGRQALLEYWPIGTAPDDPFRLYRKIRRGADLELFILDTRQYRNSNTMLDGPDKTMLGAAQRDWLLEELGRSTATWKIIASSVPLSNAKPGSKLIPGNDSWALGQDGTGFQTELRGIVQQILDRRIRNVVWLVTDVHYAQVNEYDPDRDGLVDFRELICGPLSAALVNAVLPNPVFNPTTLYTGEAFQNFGVVTITGPSLRLEIMDETGSSRYSRTFRARSEN
jgi:alkaline phosphatase D